MSDHISDLGKMVSARDEAVERALMAAWCDPIEGVTDEDAFLSALAAAGYAVVPVEPTREMLLAAPGRTNQATEESMYHGIYRAMLAAAKETQA